MLKPDRAPEAGHRQTSIENVDMAVRRAVRRRIDGTMPHVGDVTELLARVLDAYPDVLVAYLFGSVARGEAGPLSDIDIAVLLREGEDPLDRRLALMADLAEATGIEHVDVVILNEAPVTLAYRVLRDGRLLLSRDERARIGHRARTVDRYLDMEPFRRVQAEGLRDRMSEGRFGRS